MVFSAELLLAGASYYAERQPVIQEFSFIKSRYITLVTETFFIPVEDACAAYAVRVHFAGLEVPHRYGNRLTCFRLIPELIGVTSLKR